ncbi:MAG: hypothetical protein JXQ23_04070 [Clostridia bacterium]|nr:hypothetical protein [Clostridia bacterium]
MNKKKWIWLITGCVSAVVIYFLTVFLLMKPGIPHEILKGLLKAGLIFHFCIIAVTASVLGLKAALLQLTGQKEKLHEGFIRMKLLLVSMTVLTVLFAIITAISLLTVADNELVRKTAYDDESIVLSEGDSFSYKTREKTLDENSVFMDFRRFYGVETFFVIENEDIEDISIEYEVNLSRGHLRIILVTEKKEMIVITEDSCRGKYLLESGEEKCYVKVTGENASGNLNILINGR